MHGCLIQGGELQHKRRDGKNDQSTDSTCDQAKHSGSVPFGFFQVALSHDLTKQNGSCACDGKAEYGADVSHYRYQGIGGYCVCAKMP